MGPFVSMSMYFAQTKLNKRFCFKKDQTGLKVSWWTLPFLTYT